MSVVVPPKNGGLFEISPSYLLVRALDIHDVLVMTMDPVHRFRSLPAKLKSSLLTENSSSFFVTRPVVSILGCLTQFK